MEILIPTLLSKMKNISFSRFKIHSLILSTALVASLPAWGQGSIPDNPPTGQGAEILLDSFDVYHPILVSDSTGGPQIYQGNLTSMGQSMRMVRSLDGSMTIEGTFDASQNGSFADIQLIGLPDGAEVTSQVIGPDTRRFTFELFDFAAPMVSIHLSVVNLVTGEVVETIPLYLPRWASGRGWGGGMTSIFDPNNYGGPGEDTYPDECECCADTSATVEIDVLADTGTSCPPGSSTDGSTSDNAVDTSTNTGGGGAQGGSGQGLGDNGMGGGGGGGAMGGDVAGGGSSLDHETNDITQPSAGAPQALNFKGNSFISAHLAASGDYIEKVVTAAGTTTVTDDTDAGSGIVGYTIRFYGPGDVPETDPAQILRAARWTSDVPNDTYTLRFIEKRFNNDNPVTGGSVVETKYVQVVDSSFESTWTVFEGAEVGVGLADFEAAVDSTPVYASDNDFLRKTVILKTERRTIFEELVTTYEMRADTAVWQDISEVENVFSKTLPGKPLSRQTIASGSEDLVRRWTYSTSSLPGMSGRLTGFEDESTGYEAGFSWDSSNGRLTQAKVTHKDSIATGANQTYDYSYSAGSSGLARTEEFKTGGAPTEKRFVSRTTKNNPVGGGTSVTSTMSQGASSGASSGSKSTSLTRQKSDGGAQGSAGKGRIVGNGKPNGTITSKGFDLVADPFTNSGPSNWKYQEEKNGSADGQRGTMMKTWFDPIGNLRKQEHWTLDFEGTPGNIKHLSTYTESNLDGVGRPRTYTRSFEAPSGGSAPVDQVSSRIYACCGIRSDTDYLGIQTVYHYDHLVRLETSTTLGLTSAIQYNGKQQRFFQVPEASAPVDSHGHYTARVSSLPSSAIITAFTERDEALQLISSGVASSQSQDGDDPSTLEMTSYSHDYSGGRRVITITYPDNGVETRTYYKDGSLQKSEGSAVNNRYYDYGTSFAGVTLSNGAAFGVKVTEAKEDGTLGPGTQWTASFVNFLGQRVLTHYADGKVATSHYDSITNQLIRKVDPDGVTSHYGYNAEGEAVFSAVSLDGNNTLDFGVDRVRFCQTDAVTTEDGNYGYRQTCRVYRNGSDTSSNPDLPDGLITSVEEVSLDGLERFSKPFNDSNRLATQKTILSAGTPDWTSTSIAADGLTSISSYFNGLLTNKVVKGANGAEVIADRDYFYDGYLRVNKVNDARKGDTTYTYWNSDQLRSSTLVRGSSATDDLTTSYAYDDLGRLTVRDLPDTTTGPYGGTNLTNTTSWDYDPRGNVSQEYGGQTYPRTYTYDGLSRLKTLTTDYGDNGSGGSAGSSLTTWNYDPLRGWLDNKRYDDGKGPDYTYSDGGRLLTRQWARLGSNGQRITATYEYDFDGGGITATAGDLTGITHSNKNTSGYTADLDFTYKRWGAHQSVTDSMGLRTFTYRENIDLKQSTESVFGRLITRAYDSLGRPEELQLGSSADPDEDHVCGQSYDSQTGRVETITHGAVTAADAEFEYGYRANSHLLQTRTVRNQLSGNLASNHTTTFYHEAYRDLVTRVRAIANTNRSDNWYVYNQIGQRTRVRYDGSIMGGADGSYYYHYNAKGELDKTQRHASPNYSRTSGYSHTRDYGYDEIGNRLSAEFTWHNPNPDSVTTESYSPNNLNEYDGITTAGVTVSKSHDDDGNLIDDGDKIYEWDADNRLHRVKRKSDGVAIANYYYDYRGRRIYKDLYAAATGSGGVNSGTLFFYDGWNLIAEYDISDMSILRKYTWGTDLSGTKQGAGGVGGLLCVEDADGKHYPTYDANGNVIAVLDDDASATGQAWYTYDGFGKTFGSGGTYQDKMKFRFSTKYYDEETGFYYYGYRYYDPQTGRWPSRDPIGERGGVNLYCMLANSVSNSIDYLGLDFWIEGHSGGEPTGHLSISVGKPVSGGYVSYSFGVDMSCPVSNDSFTGASLSGVVYPEDPGDAGGEIQSGTYHITAGKHVDDAIVDALNDVLGDRGNYNPLYTCREWSKEALEEIIKDVKDKALQKDPPFKSIPNLDGNERSKTNKTRDKVLEGPSGSPSNTPSGRGVGLSTSSSGGATSARAGWTTPPLSTTSSSSGATSTSSRQVTTSSGGD